MNWTSSCKQIAFIAAIVTMAGTAAFASVELAHPRPFPDRGLGLSWQCTRKAGFLTVCTKNPVQANRLQDCPTWSRPEAISRREPQRG